MILSVLIYGSLAVLVLCVMHDCATNGDWW